MGIKTRYEHNPKHWAPDCIDVGSDVYLVADRSNPSQVAVYHWCELDSQWKGISRENFVLIFDPITLEKPVEFYCCTLRGRVSSGVFTKY